MDRYPPSPALSSGPRTPPTRSETRDPEQMLTPLQDSIAQLEAKKLTRTAQEVKLQLARELIEQDAWGEALKVLRPLWQGMSYRHEGWWDVVEEIGWTTRMVAERVGDRGTVLIVDWELMNSTFTPRKNWRYNIMNSLEGLEAVNFKPAVVIRDHDVHSFLAATFAFEVAEGKVGESCTSQLTVTSNALSVAAPITMTEIKISFEGSMRPIILRHIADRTDDEDGPESILHNSIALHDAPPTTDSQTRSRDSRHAALYGEADLTFLPGKSKVFEFMSPLREAGETKADTATFSLGSEFFDLDHIVSFKHTTFPAVWWFQKHGRKRIVRMDPHAMNVLPKPPKMDLRFATLEEQYYTNEPIKLKLDVNNSEEDESVARLVVRITGDQAPLFTLRSAQFAEEELGPESAEAGSSYLELGSIPSSASTSAFLMIPPVMMPSIFDVTVELSYHLVSDMETPISKTTTIRLMVVSPFEANYDFSPRTDLNPWPSYFIHNEENVTAEKSTAKAAGLSQQWCLTTRYASFATEPLIIEDIDLDIVTLNGGIACTTDKSTPIDISESLPIEPKTIKESKFLVQTRKISLDDRRSASLDLQLMIRWRRPSGTASTASEKIMDSYDTAKTNVTKLPIPRLLVASSEPRVLASVTYSRTPSDPPISLLHLTFTVENPSLHFLTFSITTSTLPSAVPPSPAVPPHLSSSRTPSRTSSPFRTPSTPVAAAAEPTFAFSGPKQSTLQLLPLSRRSVNVRVLPNVAGQWIRVGFRVQDRYFQKVLRVLPGGEGLRSLGPGAGAEGGVSVWVPPMEEDEEAEGSG